MKFFDDIFPKRDKRSPLCQKIWFFRPWLQIYITEVIFVGFCIAFLFMLIFGFSFKVFFYSFVFWFLLIAIKRISLYLYEKKHEKRFGSEVILVTGGACGLGKKICLELLKETPEALIIWDVQKQALEETVTEFQKSNPKVRIIGTMVDVSNYELVQKEGSLILEEFGRLDVLVNNAGIFSSQKLLDTNIENIHKVINVNMMSHFYTLKVFLPSILEKRHGSIVSIVSTAGINGTTIPYDYSASKFGAFGICESLRIDLKYYYKLSDQIHTTIVCPHLFDSRLFAHSRTNIVGRLTMDYIARQTVEGMKKKRDVVIVPQFFAWTCFHRMIATYFCNGKMNYGDWWTYFLGIPELMDDWSVNENKDKKKE